jgi:hypothetical protein
MSETDNNDDGYGKHWDYRVVSMQDTEPDAPEGQRYLAIHRADYVTPYLGLPSKRTK